MPNIIQTVKHVFAHLTTIPGEANLILASADERLTAVRPEVLIQRMADRELQFSIFPPKD